MLGPDPSMTHVLFFKLVNHIPAAVWRIRSLDKKHLPKQ